jgi:hypothetical protein
MELEDDVLALVRAKADLAPETAAGLAAIGAGLVAQLGSDLRGAKGAQIVPDDIYDVLSYRATESVITKLRAFHADLLLRRKRRKIARLRAVGYGSKNDHVEFVRACLASSHDTISLANQADSGDTEDSDA